MFNPRTILLSLLLVFPAMARLTAQPYFQNIYAFPYQRDLPGDMLPLPDGRVALTGSTHAGNDLYARPFVLMLERDGTPVWMRTYARAQSGGGAAVAAAADGAIVMLENTHDSVTAFRAGLVKVDAATGSIVWSTAFNAGKGVRGVRIDALPDGGFFVLAVRPFTTDTAQAIHTVCFKIDATGALVWETSLAGEPRLQGYDAAVMPDGEVWVTGLVRSALPTAAGSFLARLSPTGDVTELRTYSGMMFTQLALDASGGIALAGFGNDAGGNRVAIVQKVNATTLATEWRRGYAPAGPSYLEPSDLHVFPDGSALLTGHDPLVGYSNTMVIGLSASGTTHWARKYVASGVNDYLLLTRVLANDDILVAGATGKNFDDLDIWFGALDAWGQVPECCIMDVPVQETALEPTETPLFMPTVSGLQFFENAYEVRLIEPLVQIVCPPPGGAEASVLQAPTAFTPNGDSHNDRFRLLWQCVPQTVRWTVYNRWGQAVYSTTDPDAAGWDGTVDGQTAPADVYVWAATLETTHNGKFETISRHGAVTLLR